MWLRSIPLIASAKRNDIDPQAWLADVLARLPDHPAKRIHDLLPWNWRPRSVAHTAASFGSRREFRAGLLRPGLERVLQSAGIAPAVGGGTHQRDRCLYSIEAPIRSSASLAISEPLAGWAQQRLRRCGRPGKDR